VSGANSDNSELAMEGRQGISWHHACCSTLGQPGVSFQEAKESA
jgi:hypothetical protein